MQSYTCKDHLGDLLVLKAGYTIGCTYQFIKACYTIGQIARLISHSWSFLLLLQILSTMTVGKSAFPVCYYLLL